MQKAMKLMQTQLLSCMSACGVNLVCGFHAEHGKTRAGTAALFLSSRRGGRREGACTSDMTHESLSTDAACAGGPTYLEACRKKADYATGVAAIRCKHGSRVLASQLRRPCFERLSSLLAHPTARPGVLAWKGGEAAAVAGRLLLDKASSSDRRTTGDPTRSASVEDEYFSARRAPVQRWTR
jgi:hypothetical protein